MPHLQLGWKNRHRGLRGLFVYQDKSLKKYTKFQRVHPEFGKSTTSEFEDFTVGSETTIYYRSEERSGYWQVDTYCYVFTHELLLLL